MIRKRIEDYISDGDKFDELLATAIRETPLEKGRVLDTLAVIYEAWQNYGLRGFMSEGQWAVLCRAAEYEETD